MFFNLIGNKFEKILSIENFFKISREIKFYSFFFLDHFKKKLLNVCPTPNKRKIDDSIIFEAKFPSLLVKINSESNRLNAKVLDYFMNSKDWFLAML